MPEPSWTFTPSPIAYRRGYDRGLFEVGGSLYWIIGLDFGFDPLEFADFILGFAAIDIMEDDPSGLPEDDPESRDHDEQDPGPQPVIGVERRARAG